MTNYIVNNNNVRIFGDEEDNDEKTTDYVIISLETLISTNKDTYVYNSGGYQITLTKKEIDTTDMWRYAV